MSEEQDRLVMLLKRKPVSEVSELFSAQFRENRPIWVSRGPEEESIAQENYAAFLAEHGWNKGDFLSALDNSISHRRTLDV